MNIPRGLRILLWPLSLLYGAAVLLRASLYQHGWLKQKRLNGIVISVGNLTVGGTGKTPMVLWLAEKFLAEGKRVAILSRGYRGTGGSSDEVELMKMRLQYRSEITGGKNRFFFGVGKDRFTEGQRLESQRINVFLLDDGFQHLQLRRDLDVVLIDASRSMQAEALLPSGLLREPPAALRRADMVILTRRSPAPDVEAIIRRYTQAPMGYARNRLLGFRRHDAAEVLLNRSEIGAGPFLAFCGIGNPDAFFGDLLGWGVPVAGQAAFSDHHIYSALDMRRLEDSAARMGAKALIATEKDAQNLGDLRFASLPVYICEIELELNEEAVLQAVLDRTLKTRSGAAA